MSKTILIATEKPFAPEAIEEMKKVINEAGDFKINLLEHYDNSVDLNRAIANVDALIVRSDKILEGTIEAAKNLQIIVRAGAGYDNIDLDAATKRDIVVMNTPGQNSNGVAELAFGLMLGLIRHKYLGGPGTELKGKSIGMHGFGNIGKCMSKIAKGFDMLVYAYDPYVDNKEMQEYGVEKCENAEELYEKANFISLNIPVNEQTKKSINYKLLSKTGKEVVLVNTARMELIDEDGLMKIMHERPGFMYTSDIAPKWKVEMEEEFPMRTLFTTKKMGAQTVEANLNSGIAAVTQIVNYFSKGDTTFQVNK
jgi:D-3-phosphoglycerate dehydrogenase